MGSGRSVLLGVGCLCTFVDAPLRIGGRCRILQGTDTHARIEVMRFGSSQAEGETPIEGQADPLLYQQSRPALQAHEHHQDARQASQADRPRRVLRGVVTQGYPPNTLH